MGTPPLTVQKEEPPPIKRKQLRFVQTQLPHRTAAKMRQEFCEKHGPDFEKIGNDFPQRRTHVKTTFLFTAKEKLSGERKNARVIRAPLAKQPSKTAMPDARENGIKPNASERTSEIVFYDCFVSNSDQKSPYTSDCVKML